MDPETKPLLADSSPIPGYRLIARMGEGQFGQVWRAEGPGGHEVALKFLKMDDAGGAREFKSVQRIKTIHHPHLVALFASWIRTPDGRLIDESTIPGPAEKGASDTQKTPELGNNETLLFDEFSSDLSPQGIDDTSPATGDATTTPVESLVKSLPPGCELVVAMELGDKTLEDRLDECPEGGIPREELLDYMEEAAKGIDHLNQKKMIHGDIKPTNLVLVGGAVKLCDYGLARYFDDERMTIAAMGTPRYAAPELIKGHPAATSDQYCLAITYRDLRTGILEGPPSLSDLPAAEREVIERAISPDPAVRYSSCREMVAELRTGRPKRSLWPRLLAASLLLTAIVVAATIGVKFLPLDGSVIPSLIHSPIPSSAKWKRQFDVAIGDRDWETVVSLLKEAPLTLGGTELDDARSRMSDEWKKAFDDCIANGKLGNAGRMAESFPSVISEDIRSNCLLALQDAWRGAFDSLLHERSFRQAEELLDDHVTGIGGQEIGKLADDLVEQWRSSFKGSVETRNVGEAERILNEAPKTALPDVPKLREELCEQWRGWMEAAIVKRDFDEANGLLDGPPKEIGSDKLSEYRQRIGDMVKPPTFPELAATIRKTLASLNPAEARKILNSAESAHGEHAEYKIWDNLINLYDQSTSGEDCINRLNSVKTGCPLPMPKFETLLGSDFWSAWAESSKRLVRDPKTSWQLVDAAAAVAGHLEKCAPANRPAVAGDRRRALYDKMVELRLRSETDPDNAEREAYDRLQTACKDLAVKDGLTGIWLLEQELKRDPSNQAARDTLGRIEIDDEWKSYHHFVNAYAWATLGDGNWPRVCEELLFVFPGPDAPPSEPIPAWVKQAAELAVDAADKLLNGISRDFSLSEVAGRLSSGPFLGNGSETIYALLSRIEKDYSGILPADRVTRLQEHLALAAASADDPIAAGARQRTVDLDTAGHIVLAYWTFRCRLQPPIDAEDEKVLLTSGRSLFEALSAKAFAGTLTERNCAEFDDVLIAPLLRLSEIPTTRGSAGWVSLLEAVGDFVWLHKDSDWKAGARNGGSLLCESLYSRATKLLEPEDSEALRKHLASCHLKLARSITTRTTWSAEEVSTHVSKAIALDPDLESHHAAHYVEAEISRQRAKDSPSEYLQHIQDALKAGKKAVEAAPQDSLEQVLYKVTLSGVHMLWAHYAQDETFETQKKELREAVNLADEAVKAAGHRYVRDAQLALGNASEDLAWLAAESLEKNYARAIVAFRRMNAGFSKDPQFSVSEARCYYRIVVQSRLDPTFFNDLDSETRKGLNPVTLKMDREQLMRESVRILDGVKSGDRFRVEACYYAAKALRYLATVDYCRRGETEAPGGPDECLERLTEAWKLADTLKLPNRSTYLFELVGYPLTKVPQSETCLDEVEKSIADWTQSVMDGDFPQQAKTDWEIYRKEIQGVLKKEPQEVPTVKSYQDRIAVCNEILDGASQPGLAARIRILMHRAGLRAEIGEFSDAREDYLILAKLAYDASSSVKYQTDAALMAALAAYGNESMEQQISRLTDCWDSVESAAKLAENEPSPQEVMGQIAMMLASLYSSQQDHNQACNRAPEAVAAYDRYNKMLLSDPTSSKAKLTNAAKNLGGAVGVRDRLFQAACVSLTEKPDQDFESQDTKKLLKTAFEWLDTTERNAAQNALHKLLKPRYDALPQ